MGGGDYDDGGMGGSDYDGGGMGMGGLGLSGMGMNDDGTGGLGTGERLSDPAHKRYVDAAFRPISGTDLRTRIKSESPEDAYFAVAKRVPVRMRVTLDIRRLQDFIASCGNEGLMFEVRQVRLGDTSAATLGSGQNFGGGISSGGMSSGGMGGRGMGGMGMGGMGDSGSGMGMGGMGMGGMGMGGMGMGGMDDGTGGAAGMGGTRPARRSFNNVKVELYGTVYLFYPVNIDRLGLSKVEEGFELQDSVEEPVTTQSDAGRQQDPQSTSDGDPSAGGPAPSNGNSKDNNNTDNEEN
jgi:hypothetical protein